MLILLLLTLSYFYHPWARGQTQPAELDPVVVESQSTRNNSLSRIYNDEVNRVQIIKPYNLRIKQAQTFSQLIDNERGIDAQTSCAFCGAKRLTINGLRGEHTTLLVDGLPLHSTVSSFYGVDAVPLAGIDSIEVYRGSGAALSAPESIGGAINITTKDVLANAGNLMISRADDGQQFLNGSLGLKLGSKASLLVATNLGLSPRLDLDSNLVSELPSQSTQGLLAKLTYAIDSDKDLSFRVSRATMKSFGGSLVLNHLQSPTTDLVDGDDFKDNDVRNPFLGTQSQIADTVSIDRSEAALIYNAHQSNGAHLRIAVGHAQQDQASIYNHGYDYANRDLLTVSQLQYRMPWTESHLIAVGIDSKDQQMDSRSQVLYQQMNPPLLQDDLTYSSIGAFIQDTWVASESFETSLVLRADHLKINWLDLNREISQTIFAPRLMLKKIHNSVLTSRFSTGVGYRIPMSLFESQHGTNHYGFLVDIDKVEISQSMTYSLMAQWIDDFIEASTHITRLENMAYGLDRADLELPTVFTTADETFFIPVFDISYGRRITPHWSVEILAETFRYSDSYKIKLPVAAIEDRFTLTSDINLKKWSFSQRLNIIGARNLAKYGYDKHYNRATTDSDPLSDTFGDTFASEQKLQSAPAFMTLDLNFEYRWTEDLTLAVGLLNVLDETQTKRGDGPTTWALHGNHYHLDNFHLWGPLRGRQIFLTLSGSI